MSDVSGEGRVASEEVVLEIGFVPYQNLLVQEELAYVAPAEASALPRAQNLAS